MGKTSFSGPILGSSDSNAGSLDGIPLDLQSRSQWVTYFDDFNDLTANDTTTADFSLTQVSGGGTARIAILAAEGADIGCLVLDCPANLDGPEVQWDWSIATGLAGTGVTTAASVSGTSVATEFLFAARFAIQDVSAQGMFIGLAELISGGSAIIATPNGSIISDTHIGFSQSSVENGAIIFSAAGSDDTAASSITGTTVIGSPLSDGEFIEVAVRGNGLNQYEAFVKEGGARKRWSKIGGGSMSTDWDKQLLISAANLGGGTDDDLLIDYVYLTVKRDLLV